MSITAEKSSVELLLVSPRGFCTGADRITQIVEMTVAQYGPPACARHEIVHNLFVVEGHECKGAVFVEELTQVSDGAHVVFSTHSVPKSVSQVARLRKPPYLDATRPHVSKAHVEAEQLHEYGYEIDWATLNSALGLRCSLGLKAGTSAPKILIDEVIAALREHYEVEIKNVMMSRESARFKLPHTLVS